MSMQRILPAAALAALLSLPAAAAEPEMKTPGSTPEVQVPGGPPEVKTTSGGVRYVSGGVGEAEKAAMRKMALDYSLDLLFATEKGRHMAGVKVSVKKADGEEVLSTVSDGPMLLVDLPPGRYTVEAAAEGKTFTRKVNLAKGKHRQVVVRWPSVPEQQSPQASTTRP